MMRLGDLVREHRALIGVGAALLLVMGALDARAAYQHVDAQSHDVLRTRWTEHAAYTYSVPVTRNATLWPNGTVLPMGMPAYYRTVSDHVDLAFAWRAAGLAGANGTVDADMVLHVRAATSTGRIYWELHHPLAHASTQEPASGVALAARLDLDPLSDEVQRVAKELPPGDGAISWSVETTVAYAVVGSDAPPDAEKNVYAFPIIFSDPRIVLPPRPDVTTQTPHTTSHTVTTRTQAGWDGVASSLRALALLASGIVCAVAFAWAERGRQRGTARDAAFHREHARFREWISPIAGGLDPRRLTASPIVDLPTLEDLVETAADARVRVLLDEPRRVYYAILPQATFRYAGHARRRAVGRTSGQVPARENVNTPEPPTA